MFASSMSPCEPANQSIWLKHYRIVGRPTRQATALRPYNAEPPWIRQVCSIFRRKSLSTKFGWLPQLGIRRGSNGRLGACYAVAYTCSNCECILSPRLWHSHDSNIWHSGISNGLVSVRDKGETPMQNGLASRFSMQLIQQRWSASASIWFRTGRSPSVMIVPCRERWLKMDES